MTVVFRNATPWFTRRAVMGVLIFLIIRMLKSHQILDPPGGGANNIFSTSV
jgi:hypothetical protein